MAPGAMLPARIRNSLVKSDKGCHLVLSRVGAGALPETSTRTTNCRERTLTQEQNAIHAKIRMLKLAR